MPVYSNKTAANARRFLRDLKRACPISIRTSLTYNGKEFTDRLFGLRKRLLQDSMSLIRFTQLSVLNTG